MDSSQLFEVLKCEYCQVHFQGPIYMCALGHSHCESCTKKSDNCLECRSKLKYKNAAVMNIVENFKFTCSSCDSLFKIKEFAHHRKYSWTCYICDQNCIPEHFSLVHLKDHKLKLVSYKRTGAIKVSPKEMSFYCAFNDFFIVFSHKKSAKNITVFTTSSYSVSISYTIDGVCKNVEIPQCRNIILLSPKGSGLHYQLEFEILKINT